MFWVARICFKTGAVGVRGGAVIYKPSHSGTIFWRPNVVLHGRRKELCTLSKVKKTYGFVEISNTMAGVKRILKDAILTFAIRTTTAPTLRQVNFQKWSERAICSTLSLANVLRATMAYNVHPPLRRAYLSTLRTHKASEKYGVSRLVWHYI